jgi:hypothetical protein
LDTAFGGTYYCLVFAIFLKVVRFIQGTHINCDHSLTQYGNIYTKVKVKVKGKDIPVTGRGGP